MKRLWKIWLFALIACSCNDPYEDTTYQVYDVNPVSTYLETRADEFSEWIAILKYADLFNAINQATEVFTVFVPDNDAVKNFYTKKGISTIKDLGYDYARNLVKYHIIADSVNLETFIAGGKLVSRTLSEDYLSVAFGESEGDAGGFNSVYLNDEARVTELATRVSNGFVYKLDAVLSPLVETVYERIKESGEYRIMQEALELTGWRDSLNREADTILLPNGSKKITRRNYTLLAVTDEVMTGDGIASFDALKSKLNAGSDYTDPSNALFKYVGYHILNDSYYLSDLQVFNTSEDTSRLWGTCAANEVLMISLVNGQYFMNYDGTKAAFVEGKTDIQAKNGVVHRIDDYLPVWLPEQSTILFDFGAFPEVKSYIATNGTEGQIYQTVNATSEYRTLVKDLSCYTVEISSSGVGADLASWNYVDYFTAKSGNDFKKANNFDMLTINIGYMGNIAMKTPTLIRGKYKVTLQFGFATSMDFMRTQTGGSNGGQMKFTFDGGHEQYVAPYPIVPKKTLGMYQVVAYEELEFDATSAHTFKIVVTDPAGSTNSNFRILLDYLLFEPITE